MDNLLGTIQNATQQIFQPVSQDVQNAYQAVSSGFQNFTKQAGQDVSSLASDAYDAFSRGFQRYQNSPAPAIPIGYNANNNISDLIAKTPEWISNAAQGINNMIPGDNLASNAAKDVVNTGAGLASIPGSLAYSYQHPETIPQSLSNVGSSLVNEYKDLLTNPVGHFESHPINTILDVLPALGAVGKLGELGKAGEAGDLASSISPTEEAGLNVASPKERLASLLNYPKEMQQSGFSNAQIDQVSAPMWQEMKASDVTPNNFDDFLHNDAHSIQTAETIDAQGKPSSFNLLKGQPQSVIDDFRNWVTSRASAPIEGMVKANDFKNLDAEGIQGITKFQADPTTYPEVQNYFDNKFNQLKGQGIDVGYKQNYLPQLFNLDSQDAQDIFRTLNPNSAKFTFQSVLKNYQEGIDKGLQPRFNKISDLVGWYEQTSNKLLADNQYFNTLKSQGMIQPSGTKPGWTDLAQGFPKNTVNLGNGSTYTGSYSANPNLANAINNYLTKPDDALNKIANVTSATKNIILGSGFPKSGLNFHGLTTLARNTLAADNPVSGFMKGVNYLVNPVAAQSYIDSNLSKASLAVHSGLNLSIEDHNFLDTAAEKTNLISKANDWHAQMFSDPLFKQIIPALKLEKFSVIYDNLRSQIGDAPAAKEAAIQTNNIFGGQNLDTLARSKQTQNLLRSIVFAPDHLESYAKTGGNIVKAIADPMNPVGKVYRTMARNLVMAYVGENITNMMTSGHLSTQNDPGHELELQIGTTNDGQKRYLNPWASGIDFAKVPLDFLSGLIHSNTATTAHVISNRLSPIIGMGVHQIANTNYLGQQLYPKGANLGEQLMGRGIDAASTFLPPQVTAAAKYATGNQPAEQAITSGLQLPVRYSGGATTKAEQKQVALMQAGGASGDQINQQISAGKAAKSTTNSQPSVFNSLFQYFGLPKVDPAVNKAAAIQSSPLLAALDNKTNLSAQVKTIKTIYSSGMLPDQMNAALVAKGINPATAQQTMIKSLSDTERAPIVKEMLSQIGNNTQQYQQTIGELSRTGVLTSGVVSSWLTNGDITPQQKTLLDKQIALSKGTTTTLGSSTGTGRVGIAPTLPPKPTITYKPLNATITTPSLNQSGLKLIKQKQYSPFPSSPPTFNNASNAASPASNTSVSATAASNPLNPNKPYFPAQPVKAPVVYSRSPFGQGFGGGASNATLFK